MISRSIYGLLIFGLIQYIEGANTAMQAPLNLTAIKWAHAVNSQKFLDEVLQNKVVQMIEADVVMGNLMSNKTQTLPVMAHPPANESDLSLENFLEKINQHNKSHPNTIKGVKLDFKTLEAYKNGTEILKKFNNLSKLFWLNADILSGPGNPTTVPVDANEFLRIYREIGANNVLSLGWTTNWNKSLSSNLKYEQSHIDEMIKTIKNNQITERNITFPVRAVFAVNSLKELKNLLSKTNETKNYATLTVYSGTDDKVDAKMLRELIIDIGVERVYLDVPQKLEQELHLNSAGSLKASIFNFTLITIFMLLISKFMKE